MALSLVVSSLLPMFASLSNWQLMPDSCHVRTHCQKNHPLTISATLVPLPSSRGTKRPLLIAKHQVTLPERHHHIRMMVMAGIDEVQRHRHQIGMVPVKLWPQKDSGMRAVSTWKLNDLNTSMQVERDEVTGT